MLPEASVSEKKQSKRGGCSRKKPYNYLVINLLHTLNSYTHKISAVVMLIPHGYASGNSSVTVNTKR